MFLKKLILKHYFKNKGHQCYYLVALAKNDPHTVK